MQIVEIRYPVGQYRISSSSDSILWVGLEVFRQHGIVIIRERPTQDRCQGTVDLIQGDPGIFESLIDYLE